MVQDFWRSVYYQNSNVSICVSYYCQDKLVMSNMTILPQKFDGNSKYLDSLFVQFEIACQINSWPENQKHYWFIRCLNRQASLYITDILQYIPVVDYAILKQSLYQRYDLPQSSYKVAFNKRKLHEGENVVKCGWDLKYLATKAYLDQLIELLQIIMIISLFVIKATGPKYKHKYNV